MKKLLFLFMFMISYVFAGESPIRVEFNKEDRGMYSYEITTVSEKKVIINHSKIKVNKGKCNIFDPRKVMEQLARYYEENPPTNALISFLETDYMMKEVLNKIPDQRYSELTYGDVIYIATAPGCQKVLEIEIPTNLGKFKFKF